MKDITHSYLKEGVTAHKVSKINFCSLFFTFGNCTFEKSDIGQGTYQIQTFSSINKFTFKLRQMYTYEKDLLASVKCSTIKCILCTVVFILISHSK